MTPNPQTVDASDDLDFADMVMRLEKFRHLPVLDGERLVGILSDRDLLRSQASSFEHTTTHEQRLLNRQIEVRKVMSRDVSTITPNATALEAALLLREKKFGALPVVDGEKVVGILTPIDFLEFAIRKLEDL